MRREGMEHYGFGPQAMKKIKVCKRCGTPNTSDCHFCVTCGEKLSKDTLYDEYKKKHIYCPYCNTVLEEAANYCPQCGRKLESDDSTKYSSVKIYTK